ncbi:CS domain-containing protein [Cryptosporidium muris RN66]|uniref:CS domain-containing protein n=1 Tax=Cryptosporidium muris (strain RN66) TaxID=441375 RepID=B6A9U8_CRYMR|nr:CS domain-containing protein [Cryptosporidium muris RN66]EEA04989.1 CS domain-containing protein [Cryptosporidium muris RN66]|eukprot:XP_002139338.1 CS domain-containing protein [Cryptosporidium muris RN66]
MNLFEVFGTYSSFIFILLFVTRVDISNCIEPDSASSQYSTFSLEKEAIQHFLSVSDILVTKDDLQLSISRGWWDLAKQLVRRTHEQDIDLSSTVRASTLIIRKHLDELVRLLNKRHAEIALLSPAFQWAQSRDFIFLNIKFTYRWNAPGALKVENEVVSITNNTFYFSALGSHSQEMKRYELKLELFDEIDADKSEWTFGSVGKLTCTLAKKESNVKWPRLLKDQNEKIPNMHIWWEMKEKFEDDFKISTNNDTLLQNSTQIVANSTLSSNITDPTFREEL